LTNLSDEAPAPTPLRIARLARFVLITANAENLAAFYQNALGFRRIDAARRAAARAEGFDVEGGAIRITLGLGRELVDLVQFDSPGAPYPEDATSSEILFQHFAVVATDMDAAFGRLSKAAGWRPISSAGPQRLPESSGGVTAFKFRDPEGHPLELLSFPADRAPSRWRPNASGEPCLGIDHSAICVADSERSIAYYEALGLAVAARSLNRGLEQEALDGAHGEPVDVIALAPARATPHLELLRYRGADARGRRAAGADLAATRLVFETTAPSSARTAPLSLTDPDGHRLLIVAPPD
jgi:catechol 2,3-dioxygenase-like lactoylglutathione lyase family enzyme